MSSVADPPESTVRPVDMTEQPQALLRAAILDSKQFVEAVFQGTQRRAVLPWQRVTIRPVVIRNNRHLQFTYSEGVQDTTTNTDVDALDAPLDDLFAMPFKSIKVVTTGEVIRVQYSKKGRPILHRDRRASGTVIPLDLAHDRAKPTLLPDDRLVPFLHRIGVMTGDGRVRAPQRRKFRQINEFLRLIAETGVALDTGERPLHVVDLGCGSAALTFATYYYLNDIAARPTTMVGVDAKEHLMQQMQQAARDLGWEHLAFQATSIAGYEADVPPDIVLALHACDTATDEALARAVGWDSKLILSAPCCHHHLQAQLARAESPIAFQPVMRHGILHERLGDLLTDALRALILRLMGYRTEVLEFVPIEHTPKNLMIRATNTHAPPTTALLEEYAALKAYFGVTPHLETLLGEAFQSATHSAANAG